MVEDDLVWVVDEPDPSQFDWAQELRMSDEVRALVALMAVAVLGLTLCWAKRNLGKTRKIA